MMKLVWYCCAALMLLSFRGGLDVEVDRPEARKAFALLNQIRLKPTAFATALKLTKDLAVKRTQLIWNDTLAKVAEAKAQDMAQRNYFAHVDPDGYGINHFISEAGYQLEPEWTQKKNANLFESIMAGLPNGEAGLRALILDESDPNKGHRNHMLGLGDWHSKSTDIGVGFVRSKGSQYQTYMCVIIARHKW